MINHNETIAKYKGKSRSYLLSVITCHEAERELMKEKVDNLSYRLDTIKQSLKTPNPSQENEYGRPQSKYKN